MYDVIIVGAGIAGLSAGIYASRGKMKTLILEASVFGGQIINSPSVENYPGHKNISGFKLAKELYDQAEALGCSIKYEKVVKIENNKVITSSGEYDTKTIIIATGLKQRKLGLSREDEFTGNGLSYCATCDGNFYRDKDVCVVGGGNTALEDVIFLSSIVNQLYVILRRDVFRADRVLVDKVLSLDNVKVIYNANIKELLGEEKLNGISYFIDDQEYSLSIDGLFVAIGLEPNNDFISDNIDLDDYGFVVSDDCTTNVENIFVAGDTRTKELRQLVTAASDGAIAAMKAINYINMH